MFQCLPNYAWAAANLAVLTWHLGDMEKVHKIGITDLTVNPILVAVDISQQNIVSDLMGHPVLVTVSVRIFRFYPLVFA